MKRSLLLPGELRIPMSTNSATFSASSTSEQVADSFPNELKDKTVIVTGGNSGVGFETCRVLSSKGAICIICSRDPANGDQAVANITKEFPNAKVSAMQLDLASLQSIKQFAEAFLSSHSELHCLINNAGVMACPKSFTADGFEMQFGVNHLGHFYLTHLLLPLLKKTGSSDVPSRVINLSSIAHLVYAPSEGILFDDLDGQKGYNDWERYGQSKLANLLFTKELQKRCSNENVISVAVHPGVIPGTKLYRHFGIGYMMRLAWLSITRPKMMWMVTADRSKNVKQGAATTVLTALDPKIEGGGYYYDCHISDRDHMNPFSNDEKMAARLWTVSENMLSQKGVSI